MHFTAPPFLVFGLLISVITAMPGPMPTLRPCAGDICACNPTLPICGAQAKRAPPPPLPDPTATTTTFHHPRPPPPKREAAPAPVHTPMPPICRAGDCTCDLTSPQCKAAINDAGLKERRSIKICLPEDCNCNPHQPSCQPLATA